MKSVLRYFFRTVRTLLSPLMRLGEVLFSPGSIVRSEEAQRKVDEACRSLAVYQYSSCPFCIKVRREMKRLALNIEKRDALRDPAARADLEKSGGRIQVPCLRIVDANGNSQWLYESDDIIAYLRERFAE